ncbi:MAG TPA: DUF4232 domain-containing protein [Candidatus Limnocylindrales bacterium]
MSPRRPALAASTPLLGLGFALLLAACQASGPSVGPASLVPTASATAAATPTDVPSNPAASPTPTPVSGTGACDPKNLAAAVVDWEGAAGHRTANVTLTNNGKATCTIHALPTPELVDSDGTVLIKGQPPTSTATIGLAYYDVVKSMVMDANYCGPAPKGPVTVAFLFPGGEGLVVATPAPGDQLGGVPPCLGQGDPADIEMQPFAP